MLEKVIKRDRAIVLIGLTLTVILSWAYILNGAGMDMSMPAGMKMGGVSAIWTPGYWVLMFVMWWVMMVAMMLPSAAPMILLFATVNKGAVRQNSRAVPTFVFAAGYLLIWGGFCLLAVVAQWALTSLDLLDQMMQSNSRYLGAALLISAGIYQFTPVKDACLKNCKSPVQFIMGHWVPGHFGALKMGLLHGAYCLGCCWFLMGLLFFGGVMNILWIGGLALYVLLEKLMPHGSILEKVVGGILVVWGVAMIAS